MVKKTPKNLTKALSNDEKVKKIKEKLHIDDNRSFDLDALIREEEAIFYDLARDISRLYLNVTHSSDFLDNMNNEEVRAYLYGKSKSEEGQDHIDFDSSDDDDSNYYDSFEETPNFDKYVAYPDVQDKYRNDLSDVLSKESYSNIPAMKKALEVARNKGFKGDERTLSNYLKQSKEFRDFATRILTDFTG